ncbi:MAG: hypothetical protein JWN84_2310 [Nocardioides sp.]|jgi:hypothetical protein|nr:hypothetical protein [Nocardioides sp.]
MAVSATDRTRALLIETLLRRGATPAELSHLSLGALGALLDATPDSRPAPPADPSAPATRDLTPATRPTPVTQQPAGLRPGSVAHLRPALAHNPSWTDRDRATILELAEEHGADGTRPSGRTVAVLNGARVLFWLSRHSIELPGGASVRLSTARPIRTSA